MHDVLNSVSFYVSVWDIKMVESEFFLKWKVSWIRVSCAWQKVSQPLTVFAGQVKLKVMGFQLRVKDAKVYSLLNRERDCGGSEAVEETDYFVSK